MSQVERAVKAFQQAKALEEKAQTWDKNILLRLVMHPVRGGTKPSRPVSIVLSFGNKREVVKLVEGIDPKIEEQVMAAAYRISA
jgi:hypothetical protein